MEETPEDCFPDIEYIAFNFEFDTPRPWEFEMVVLPKQDIYGRASYDPTGCAIRVSDGMNSGWANLTDCNDRSANEALLGIGISAKDAIDIAKEVIEIIEKIKLPKLDDCSKIANNSVTPDSDAALGVIMGVNYPHARDAILLQHQGAISLIGLIQTADVYYASINRTVNYTVSRMPGSTDIKVYDPTFADKNNNACKK